MSNPAKALKKVVKAVIVVAAVAAIAYVALPALSGATAASGAAASTGSFTAGTTALTAGGGGAAAATTAAGSGGLLGTLGAGAAKIGTAVSSASPMVKLGLIQAGSQALAAGMAPEEQTAAEQLQDQLNVYHSLPRQSRTYGTTEAQSGYVSQGNTTAAAGTTDAQYTPTAGTQSTSSGLLGRYNPTTRKWEQTA